MSDFWGVWVPTWLSAVGTVGAFGTGGVLLVRELHRDRERDAEQERERAGVFAVWPVRQESRSAGVPAVDARLALNNAGTQPVYDVTVEYLRDGAVRERDEVGMVAPGHVTRDLPRSLSETWIRSGAAGWLRQGAPAAAAIDDPVRQPWAFETAVRFTDSAGKRWHRDARGALSPDR